MTRWRTIKTRRYMQLSVGDRRESFPLSGVCNDAEADARAEMIADVVARLVAVNRFDKAKELGRKVGAARTERELDVVRLALKRIVAEGAVATGAMTVRDFSRQWTSGELHRKHPDRVQERDHSDNIGIFENHILPLIGDVPMAKFTLEDGERVMAGIPVERSASTRRQIAQSLYRLARIAHYPVRILPANPLPMGFLPRIGPQKAAPFLYPDEEAKILACREIPLVRRVAYGLLAREGMRPGELVGRRGKRKGPSRPPMPWSALDLKRGLLTLDKNKTDDPRAWVIDPSVLRALRVWREIGGAGEHIVGEIGRMAEHLRADVLLAGVDRPELGVRSKERTWLKAHHLRATFVTLSLANGKTETWVQDRTGHRSTLMINRYRRAARTAAELDLGPLKPLDRAIPELRESTGKPKASRTTNKG